MPESQNIDTAATLRTQATDAMESGDRETALERFRECLAIYERIGDRDASGGILASIGRLLGSGGEYREALTCFERSLGIMKELEQPKGVADALINIGNVHFHRGGYDEARRATMESLAIMRDIGDRPGEARALRSLGNIAAMLGELDEALSEFRASREIAGEIGDLAGEARALNNIGNLHRTRGEYASALEHYQNSIRIAREIGARTDEALLTMNIGTVHHSLGEYEPALEYFRTSLEISRETGDRSAELPALQNAGLSLVASGRANEAIGYFDASLAIGREMGNRKGEAEALNGMADAMIAGGDYGAALRHLEMGASIAREIGARSLLAHILVGTGSARARLGEHEASVESLLDALALAVEIGIPEPQLEAHLLLSRQYQALDMPVAALDHLRKHLEMKDAVYSSETRRIVNRMQNSWQIEIARKEAEIERIRNVELKRALDDLKAAQSSLVQSERMASLGQLTAGIAHEINNPINFVSASVRPLSRNHRYLSGLLERAIAQLPEHQREELGDPEEIAETIEETDRLLATVARGAERTAEIVAGLRSFSRLDEGGLKRVDLHEGLDAAVTILSGSLSSGIELVREYGELPPVECYPGEINQVFMNILTNAVRAIESSGAVTIRTEAAAETVSISISDTGCGMTPEIESRIFEPFFTTRDVGAGRGLGLSIAWGIVERHGGTIAVDSAPGIGSRFVVTLPIG